MTTLPLAAPRSTALDRVSFGLLLAFTPCMLPMIPILSGIIVGQGHALRRAQAFALSAVYVLGMAITYALAGIAAGIGIMEFPFNTTAGFWRWIDLCEEGGIDSFWQTDRLVSRQPILECMAALAAVVVAA